MTDTLFERMSSAQAPRAHARSTDPETSHMAADAITPGLTEWEYIAETTAQRFPDGFTYVDLTDARPDLKPATLRSRCADLRERNIILDTGKKVRPEGENLFHEIWIHRRFVENPPPILERPQRSTKSDKKAALAMADELDKAAKQMRAEGRTGFSDQITEAAALMRRLAH